jgi:hypothetical protein
MRYQLLLLFGLLTACNAQMYIDPTPGNDGRTLAPGQSASFRFFTTEPAADAGLNLAAGASYRLEIPLVSNWIDGEVDTDESGVALGPLGFADSLMPADAFALFKRSRQHRWFELMFYQDGCRSDSLVGLSDLQYDSQTDSYNYTAPCEGDLKLFVNDSQGAYTNNVGFARIQITRTN